MDPNMTQEQMQNAMQGAMLGAMLIPIIIMIIAYLYISISLMIIAKKTNTDNGWLAFIPIANIVLMCNIAGKSLIWLLLSFIPLINIIAVIVLWMGISEKRGKAGWIGILILVPIIGIFIPGYLAFSE